MSQISSTLIPVVAKTLGGGMIVFYSFCMHSKVFTIKITNPFIYSRGFHKQMRFIFDKLLISIFSTISRGNCNPPAPKTVSRSLLNL